MWPLSLVWSDLLPMNNNRLHNLVDVGHLQNKDTSWSKMKFALLLCFIGLQTATAISPFEAIIEEWEVNISEFPLHTLFLMV